MLQRNVNVRANLFVGGDGFQQLAGDLVGIGVKEAYPAQVFNLRQTLQQRCQAVLETQVFAITGGVLADQGNFAHAIGSQPLGLGNYRLKMPRAELPAKLRNDAETTRMV